MPGPMKTYDLTTCYCTINGIRIQGFDEDDAVSIEPVGDDVEHSVGADGEVTASRTNDSRMIATINVRENSKGAQDLGLLRAAQRAETTFTPLPFLLIDEQTGEQISSQYAVFLDTPGPSKGRLASGRAFRLLLPKGKDGIAYAPSVTA